MNDVTYLDNQTFTAVVSTHAFGCGGPETNDTASKNETATFIALGHDEELLEGLEEKWDTRWPARAPYRYEVGELLNYDRETLQKLNPQALPGLEKYQKIQEPAWTENFLGTWEEYTQEKQAYMQATAAFKKELWDAFLHPRVELLKSYGLVRVPVWVEECIVFTHDFGCRCMCYSGTFGEGSGEFRVIEGNLFCVPLGFKVDKELKLAVLEKEAELKKLLKKATDDNFSVLQEYFTSLTTGKVETYGPRANEVPEAQWTWTQWICHRKDTAEKQKETVLQLAQEGKWKEVTEMLPNFQNKYKIVDPHAKAKAQLRQKVTNLGVQHFSDQEAQQLASALVGTKFAKPCN